ncbi:MAG: hypothetical protein ACT4PO_14925 [Actinomycetota bacterium]
MEVRRDKFGSVNHDEGRGMLELVWSEATATMSEDEFKRQLELFAGDAERLRPSHVIIDVTRFAFVPGSDFGGWRDRHIIPRYNAAGIRKFAFLVPIGAPRTVGQGATPVREVPGTFLTGYFDSRDEIEAWFAHT